MYLEAAVSILGESFSRTFITVSSLEDFNLEYGEFLGFAFEYICFGFEF
jgi:hypothetical protein